MPFLRFRCRIFRFDYTIRTARSNIMQCHQTENISHFSLSNTYCIIYENTKVVLFILIKKRKFNKSQTYMRVWKMSCPEARASAMRCPIRFMRTKSWDVRVIETNQPQTTFRLSLCPAARKTLRCQQQYLPHPTENMYYCCTNNFREWYLLCHPKMIKFRRKLVPSANNPQ